MFLDNVDLTVNTGLRVLELGLVLDFYVEAQSLDGEFSSLPLLLSKLPKLSLTSIKFKIWVTSGPTPPGGLHMAEATNTIAIWDAIDEPFSGPAFPALTKVVFTIFNRVDEFEVSDYLECRMARCKQKGLLCISDAR